MTYFDNIKKKCCTINIRGIQKLEVVLLYADTIVDWEFTIFQFTIFVGIIFLFHWDMGEASFLTWTCLQNKQIPNGQIPSLNYRNNFEHPPLSSLNLWFRLPQMIHSDQKLLAFHLFLNVSNFQQNFESWNNFIEIIDNIVLKR